MREPARIADLLQVSTPAVWRWVARYNRGGPAALHREGRGGRRWAFLPWPEEEALLDSLRDRAAAAEIITAKALWPAVKKATRKAVSLDYVYRLLHRHGWLQRPGPVQRPRLSSQQRQVMQWVEGRPLVLPAPPVPRHHPVLADQRTSSTVPTAVTGGWAKAVGTE